jgi:hypothetical protein
MKSRFALLVSLLAAGCAGKQGEGVTVTPEPPGANCPTGGSRVQVGGAAATYVCNGATGDTGPDGQSAVVTSEPAGANCATGRPPMCATARRGPPAPPARRAQQARAW